MTTHNVVPFDRRAVHVGKLAPRRTDRAVYTVRQVAELLGIALGSAYTLVRQGEIPAKQLGGRWVIPKKRFHAWLDDEGQEFDSEQEKVGAL